jgi:para-nitrobenzyl esterase
MPIRFLALAIIGIITVSAAVPSDIVETSFGKVQGSLTSGTRFFGGIPYAEPPTKTRRFTAPVAWSKKYIGTRKATGMGAECISSSQKTGSEDCLFMNVYTPLDATPTSKLPVLLFIHGGSFVDGSGNGYDCTELAKQHNAVFVTINYRLGSFGWLRLGEGQANMGLKDQRQAMIFTKQEIAAFGGDPSRVMIFGESAGAISVQDHIIAKKSGGLFTAALSESGMPSAMPADFAANNTATYLAAAKCGKGSTVSILSCLQSKSTAELLAASAATSGTGEPFIVLLIDCASY